MKLPKSGDQFLSGSVLKTIIAVGKSYQAVTYATKDDPDDLVPRTLHECAPGIWATERRIRFAVDFTLDGESYSLTTVAKTDKGAVNNIAFRVGVDLLKLQWPRLALAAAKKRMNNITVLPIQAL